MKCNYTYLNHFNIRPFYIILRQQNNFEWILEHQKRTQINYCIPCAISRICAALLQSHKGTNKLNLISAVSRHFTHAEFCISTLMEECTARIYTLTENELSTL